jgi:hypothetical protein
MKFPPIRQLRPPGGAPNMLIVPLDGVGFGASSAFGGPQADRSGRACHCRFRQTPQRLGGADRRPVHASVACDSP